MQAKKNENCLADMRCPKCGSLEPFGVQVSAMMEFYDDGAGDSVDDIDWEDSFFCRCNVCGFEGVVKDFKRAAVARFPGRDEEFYEERMAEIISQYGLEHVDGECTSGRYIEVDDDPTPNNVSLTDREYHWIKAWVSVEEDELKDWLAETEWRGRYE